MSLIMITGVAVVHIWPRVWLGLEAPVAHNCAVYVVSLRYTQRISAHMTKSGSVLFSSGSDKYTLHALFSVPSLALTLLSGLPEKYTSSSLFSTYGTFVLKTVCSEDYSFP